MIINGVNEGLNANFGYAKLQNVGKLDISKTLEEFKNIDESIMDLGPKLGIPVELRELRERELKQKGFYIK